MVNAGAIAVTSLIKTDEDIADRFDYVFNEFGDITGGEYVLGLATPYFFRSVKLPTEILHWHITCKRTKCSHEFLSS